jgi:putative membrane protein
VAVSALHALVATACLAFLFAAGARGATPPMEAAQAFFRFALSSGQLQARSAQLAREKQARPEVREFADTILRFRSSQLQALESLAAQSGARRTEPELEHAAILDNLEPLDLLGFSRRWAEVQVQALQQEIRLYRDYVALPQAMPGIAAFARETLPRLEEQLHRAMEVDSAIRR